MSPSIKFEPLSDEKKAYPYGDGPLHSYYIGTGVHGRNDFNMNITSSQTSEDKSPPVLGSPKDGEVECSQVFNSAVVKGGDW